MVNFLDRTIKIPLVNMKVTFMTILLILVALYFVNPTVGGKPFRDWIPSNLPLIGGT